MICIESGLYVKVEQMVGPRAPHPLPLDSGFSKGNSYRVLGLHSPSETSEAYLILSNDRNEIWFISNRHFRTVEIDTRSDQTRKVIAFGVTYEQIKEERSNS